MTRTQNGFLAVAGRFIALDQVSSPLRPPCQNKPQLMLLIAGAGKTFLALVYQGTVNACPY
jgi:hypothetical protein